MYSSYYNPTTKIYTSPRPPLPSVDPTLSVVSFLFRDALHSFPHRLALIPSLSHSHPHPHPHHPSFTFLQLHYAVSSFAASLSLLGISKGDVVLILSPSSTLFLIAFLSVLSLGAIASPANPLYTLRELKNQAVDSNAKLVITVQSLYHKVKPLDLPVVLLTPREKVSGTLEVQKVMYFFDMIQILLASDFHPPVVNQDDVATLLYSSGTTGVSKGVVLTHRNFVSQALMVAMDQDLRGEGHNTFLCCLPMFHIMGLAVITYAQLQRGNTVVVMERFEMEAVLGTVERYRVGYLYVVPPVMIALAKLAREVRDRYDVSCLRWIGSGAAPLGKEVMEEVAKVYPYAQIVQV